MSNFIERMKQKNKNFKCSNTNKVSRVQRDTLQTATAKVLQKLRDNKALFAGTFTGDSVDTCYKEMTNGFNVGIKYGNRYLKDVFEQELDGTGGYTYMEGIGKEDMAETFDYAIELVERGECNKAIEQAIADNLQMHNKNKAK